MTRSTDASLERERERLYRLILSIGLIKLVGFYGDEVTAARAMGLSQEDVLQRLEDDNFRNRIETEKASVAKRKKKQDRFLAVLRKFGDEGEAAGKAGVGRDELAEWYSDPAFYRLAEIAKLEASQVGWLAILFDAKVIPKIMADVDQLVKDGQLDKGEGNSLAAWVAFHGVQNERGIILSAASKGDSQFFVALGRYLNGDWNRDFWDRLDEKIARNWAKLRVMSRRYGCWWLNENGFPDLTEDSYRQRLVGLKLTVGRK